MVDIPKPELQFTKAPSTAATPQPAGGGTVTPEYYNLILPTITVPIAMLRNFMQSSSQEMAQFSVAGFFLSGAFWLGIERYFTMPTVKDDVLFWVCCAILPLTGIPAYFGWKQMKSRRDQIQELLDGANKTTSTPNKPARRAQARRD